MSVPHETTIAPAPEAPGEQMKAVCSCEWESPPSPFFPLAEQHENVHLLRVGGAISVRSAMTGATRIVLVESVGAKLR
jgi:hypothetical protein